ncbi:hypothetical protein L1I30_01790 [Gillisia sp. M10.2A]|uniref:Site-specific DNA-methyltransferase (adenine-specific) n=1 Tax=Gillisia lutea TaxID=2909668 RepID=A0ABS9EBW5_9FLAO|nr:hypothetical protein [Gillisia lutea]MCF4100386.1 hypothetical protein [Gillisia lutea]
MEDHSINNLEAPFQGTGNKYETSLNSHFLITLKNSIQSSERDLQDFVLTQLFLNKLASLFSPEQYRGNYIKRIIKNLSR